MRESACTMEVGKDSDIRSTTVSSNAIGWMASSSVPVQRRHALLPSRPNRSVSRCSPSDAILPHRVQAQASHLGLHFGRDVEEVDRMRCKEGRRVLRHPGRPVSPARPGGHIGRELRVCNGQARPEVLGNGVQQGRDDTGLASVQPLQPVDAHIGRADLGRLNPVAHPLEGPEHLIEDPSVVRLVGVQHDGARLSGHGLLQGHPGHQFRSAGKTVDDHGSRPRSVSVDDQDGSVLQVGLPAHLHLRSQVSDEHAGDPHGSTSLASVWTGDHTERVFCMSISARARGGRYRRIPVDAQRQKWSGG